MKTRIAVTIVVIVALIVTSDFWLPVSAKAGLNSAWPLGGHISRFFGAVLSGGAHEL